MARKIEIYFDDDNEHLLKKVETIATDQDRTPSKMIVLIIKKEFEGGQYAS